MVMDRDPRGLLGPDSTCSKAERPVINILWEKWPEARIPSEDSFHEHPNTEDYLEIMSMFFYEDNDANAQRISRDVQDRVI